MSLLISTVSTQQRVVWFTLLSGIYIVQLDAQEMRLINSVKLSVSATIKAASRRSRNAYNVQRSIRA